MSGARVNSSPTCELHLFRFKLLAAGILFDRSTFQCFLRHFNQGESSKLAHAASQARCLADRCERERTPSPLPNSAMDCSTCVFVSWSFGKITADRLAYVIRGGSRRAMFLSGSLENENPEPESTPTKLAGNAGPNTSTWGK